MGQRAETKQMVGARRWRTTKRHSVAAAQGEHIADGNGTVGCAGKIKIECRRQAIHIQPRRQG